MLSTDVTVSGEKWTEKSFLVNNWTRALSERESLVNALVERVI